MFFMCSTCAGSSTIADIGTTLSNKSLLYCYLLVNDNCMLRIMSSQKGNINRQRPQKHQNRTVFKNSLHDTSQRTKFINNIQVANVCIRCKEIIEWKVKYKKYKPLTQPKTCVSCSQKTVRAAYHVMCVPCARNNKVCCKCCKSHAVVQVSSKTGELELQAELMQLIKVLPERKRRTFVRYMQKTMELEETDSNEDMREILLKKIEQLKMADEDLGSSSESEDENKLHDDHSE